MRLVFTDTETTGLKPKIHVAWDMALIPVDYAEDGTVVAEDKKQLFVFPSAEDLANVDLPPKYLEKFQARIAMAPLTRADKAAETIYHTTAGAILVGANVGFDAEKYETLLNRHGLEAKWHYHLLDIEPYAAGYLVAQKRYTAIQMLDWHLKDYAKALKIFINPTEEHTAMGDALTVRAIFDRITGHWERNATVIGLGWPAAAA